MIYLHKNKAQVKFGETIGIIIIVYFLLMGGLVFYNNYNQKELSEIKEKYLQNLAYERFNYLKNLNLIHYSKKGVIQEEFSYINLIVFSNYSKTEKGKEFLDTSLGKSIVTLKLFKFDEDRLKYNFDSPYLNITFYNNTPMENKRYNIKSFKTLILVYNELTKKNEVGILTLKVYYK